MKLAIHGLVRRFVDPGGGRPPVTVLDGLELVTGDIGSLVLVGPSGGGKSTLLRILAGLDVPAAGSVAFDGVPLPHDEAALRAYRRTVGTVFQAYNLFPHLTALENLLLPLVHVHGLAEAAARERVREPLERFGLAAHAHKRPAELSGGQKQRIAILRALVVQPRRLFLDEPTSALDPEMTAEVLEMIGELRAAGTQFVLVTHEMGFARHVADEIAFIADGTVLAHASAADFLDRCTTPRVRSFLRTTLPT
ncbi:MAG: amino acid ABC transporter ATP-binding protein [Planctomycetota bacterium]|jgi:polar amino acid transport system ATP-binding protein|nr:MAG: amino acid ABC transporter ATP-binding protein [Planctomycetota bacterium]